MREILFRGKLDERIDEWIEGNLWYDRDHTAHIIGSRYWGEMSKDELSSLELISWTVIPETIGEYTGLIDKNGKKIFEGDICEITTFTYEDEDIQLVGKVCFKYSSFVFQGLKHPDDEVLFSSVCDFDTDVEVIGNIYDNPELVGGRTNE